MGNGNKFGRKKRVIRDYDEVQKFPKSPTSLDLATSLTDKSITKRLTSSAARDFRNSLLHRELKIEGRHLSKQAMANLARGKGIPTVEKYVAEITGEASKAHMKASLKKAGKAILKTGTNVGLKWSGISNPSLEPIINLTGYVLSDVIKGPYTWERWWWEHGRHHLRTAYGTTGSVKLSGLPLSDRIEDLVVPRGEVTIGRPIISRHNKPIQKAVTLNRIKGLPKFEDGIVQGSNIGDFFKSKYMDKMRKYVPPPLEHKPGVPPPFKHVSNKPTSDIGARFKKSWIVPTGQTEPFPRNIAKIPMRDRQSFLRDYYQANPIAAQQARIQTRKITKWANKHLR